MKIAVSLTLSVLLSGCATSGTQLSEAQVARIKVGKTKYNDVIKIAGEPMMEQDRTQEPGGPSRCDKAGSPIKIMMYPYAKGNIVSGTKSQTHIYYLNEAGVVCHAGVQKTNQGIW